MSNQSYTKLYHQLLKNKELTDQDKITLSIIISFFSNKKDCFIGNDRLGDMLGISSNAASIRINRLKKLGLIDLSYTYLPSKKKIDKRYITLTALTIQVLSPTPQVSSPTPSPLVSQTGGDVLQTGYIVPQTDTTSSKQGGIRQPVLKDNLLENLLNNLII